MVSFPAVCCYIDKYKRSGSPGQVRFSIQFLDVGQADAALVQCDGKYMLIDGGKSLMQMKFMRH